jgi:pimeloyl-ACP methyl ester carboxylesterase
MRNFVIGVLLGIAVLAGACIYFSEPSIPRATLEAKYALPPSKFMMLPDGARAHYRDQGPRNAQVLLLIHGSNSSLLTWEPWVKRLSDSFRIVTVDMPGHGLTGVVPNEDYSQEGMVKFTKEFADKIGLSRFAIGGNSMGGAVAAQFAEEFPASVTNLILVDAGGMQTQQGDRVPLVFRLARVPVLNRLMAHITPRSLVVEGLNDAIVHKEIINDKMIDWYWDFARMRGSRTATIERFNLPWTSYVRDHVGTIHMPTLILWGEEDHLIPVESAHAYNKAISGSKLIIYPDTGHLPQEEVADRSATDVRVFLMPPQPMMQESSQIH